ncbi:MAG: hypothetical protein IKR59_01710 [Lachnospiraceae bacterium]|nr:hypothetical protein [Lachnospiraceae bacterium]
MLNKKLLCLLLILAMVLSLAACKKQGGNNDGSASGNSTAAPAAKSESTTADSNKTKSEKPAGNGGQTASAMVPGKLNFITLDDRDSSVIRGITVYGNRCGSPEYNAKPTATEGIRCIFELNEYVGFIPDTDATYGIRVWILEHREDQKFYETTKFADQMPGFVQYCDLHFDTDEPDSNYWGEFYLNPEDCKAGYYDFVFVYEGKAVATMLTYFYNQGELEDKSDAELDKLAKGL